MTQEAVTDFIAGGYFITKTIPPPVWRTTDAELLPASLITLSNCLTGFAPDDWALEWVQYTDENRLEKAAEFGLTAETLPAVTQWVTEQFNKNEIGWPNLFYRVNTAHQFKNQFLPASQDLILIGLGLDPALVDEFLEKEKPPEGIGADGVYEALGQKQKLETGGEFLGFDFLGFDTGSFHSWLCNLSASEVYQATGIRPNDWGLFSKLEQAKALAEYANRPDASALEPAIWLPWLVVKYQI
jgi:hypothetical protein